MNVMFLPLWVPTSLLKFVGSAPALLEADIEAVKSDVRETRTAPDRIAPYRTVAYHIVPRRTVPYHTTSYRTVPHHSLARSFVPVGWCVGSFRGFLCSFMMSKPPTLAVADLSFQSVVRMWLLIVFSSSGHR